MCCKNRVKIISANYTLEDRDSIVIVDTDIAIGDVIVTVPLAATRRGKEFTIINGGETNTNSLFLVRSGSDQIGRLPERELPMSLNMHVIVSNGTDQWEVKGSWGVSRNTSLVGRVVLNPGFTSNVVPVTSIAFQVPQNRGIALLDPDADYVLVSTPQILGGVAGEVKLIMTEAGEANSVTFQDESIVVGSKMKLGAPQRTIGDQQMLIVLFDGMFWLEVLYRDADGNLHVSGDLTVAGTAYLNADVNLLLAGSVALGVNQNNYQLPAAAAVPLYASGAIDVTGFVAPTGNDGNYHIIINRGVADITFKNDSGSSSVGNRLYTKGAGDYGIAPNESTAFIYNNIDAHWQQIGA